MRMRHLFEAPPDENNGNKNNSRSCKSRNGCARRTFGAYEIIIGQNSGETLYLLDKDIDAAFCSFQLSISRKTFDGPLQPVRES